MLFADGILMFNEDDNRTESEIAFQEHFWNIGIKYAGIEKRSYVNYWDCGNRLFPRLHILPKVQSLIMFFYHRFKC